jgi:hypothetical protein
MSLCNHRMLRACLVTITGWLVGCDALVSPAYAGESLLRISGNVEISRDRPAGELIPALAFLNDHGLSMMDVSAQGTFPSDFQLDVCEPPPESVLKFLTVKSSGEPRVALGWITAAPADHPEIIYSGSEVGLTVYGCRDVGRADHLCLHERASRCVPELADVPCFFEDTFCPRADSPREQCVIEKKGNPALSADTPLDFFAGLSQNYQVFYLEEAAPAGSITARLLGAPGGVPAGYGLYEARHLNEQDQSAAKDCWRSDASAERSVEIYNELNGTDYPSLKCDDLPFCRSLESESERLKVRTSLVPYFEAADADLGCPSSYPLEYVRYTRVDHPERAAISIVIQPDLPTR